MTVNPSPTVRLVVYIIGGVGSLVAAYLFGKGFIGQEEAALWSGLVALAFGVAGLNTPTAELSAGKRRKMAVEQAERNEGGQANTRLDEALGRLETRNEGDGDHL